LAFMNGVDIHVISRCLLRAETFRCSSHWDEVRERLPAVPAIQVSTDGKYIPCIDEIVKRILSIDALSL
jgi:hypothetical protein